MPTFSVMHTDALELLRELPDESVNMIVTDPPYESLEKHRKVGTTTRLKKEWFDIFPNHLFFTLFEQFYRVLARNSHFYMFSDQETMRWIIRNDVVEATKFKFWKPIVWDKVKIGMGYHYRARYEFILFFEKGKRKLRNLGIPDIIESPRIHRGRYPTEKPVEVFSVLTSQSTIPGELVLDPFIGAGGSGVAALQHGCNFIGADTEQKAVKISRDRMLGLGVEARLTAF